MPIENLVTETNDIPVFDRYHLKLIPEVSRLVNVEILNSHYVFSNTEILRTYYESFPNFFIFEM